MTNTPEHSISVIIACYNAQDTIARAIKSALDQAYVTEVIVVDDCSTDDSIAVSKTADDGTGRLSILKQDQNQGPSAARNRALDTATGQWIAILDSDDFFLPGRIDALLKHADTHDIIADDLYQTDEDHLTPPFQTLLRPALTKDKDISLTDFVLSNVTKGKRTRGELGFIKPIIRKSLIDKHNIRYQTDMRLGEDYELYVRLLAHGARLVIIPAAGYVAIRRENSLSGEHRTADLKFLRDCNTQILEDFDLSADQQNAIKAHYNNTNCRYQWRRMIDGVREKNVKQICAAYIQPFPVPIYITQHLFEHFYKRAFDRKAA